ncbi:MAG TPA: serine/threonine-protein kinase, partial [Byssovorax sp.]
MNDAGDSGILSTPPTAGASRRSPRLVVEPSQRTTLRGGFGGRRSRDASLALTSRDLEPFDPSTTTVADPLLGVVVADRYRILEPIGRGGMGAVYKVAHLRIGKLVAMKLLAGDLARDADVARRFKREAFAASRLESPNTVQVFDYGVTGDFTFLVMELVRGESLGRVLRASGPMPVGRLVRIMVQVCNALAEAHEKGVVHRDVKPDNVMIMTAPDGGDVVKVLDFGLAKLRDADGIADITSHGTIVGTPYYMAPEQIRGDEVDARTDVYACGALMYRLSTGCHPFSGPPMSVMAKQIGEEPVPPGERAPELEIPEGLSRIILRALKKDPGARYQSVEELRAALVDEVRASGSSSAER